MADVIEERDDFNTFPDVYDLLCSFGLAVQEYVIKLIFERKQNTHDAILLAVGHGCFEEFGPHNVRALIKKKNAL